MSVYNRPQPPSNAVPTNQAEETARDISTFYNASNSEKKNKGTAEFVSSYHTCDNEKKNKGTAQIVSSYQTCDNEKKKEENDIVWSWLQS